RSADSVAATSLRSIAPPAEQQRFEAESAVYKKQMDALDRPIEAVEKAVRADFSDVEKEEFQDEMKRAAILKKRVPARLSEEQFQQYVRLTEARVRLRAAPPRALEQALCVTERGGGPAPATFVLLRGSAHAPGDEVQPGFPSVLPPAEPGIHTPR